MLSGLQIGFGGLLGADLLREIKEQGFDMGRIQAAPVHDAERAVLTPPEHTTAIVQEVLDADLRPYTIIVRAEQIESIPPGTDIEFGNEPDLGARFGWPSAAEYISEMHRAIAAAEGRNPLWVGVVSNLNNRGFKFLERMQWSNIPPWVGCAVHRYPDGDLPNPRKPSKDRRLRGPNHRDAEIHELRRIVGPDRRLGLSEIGYHRGHGQTDDQVAANMAFERELFARHGFEFAIAYQLLDGTGTTPDDMFGFRRWTDDRTSPFGPWKPVAAVWTGRK